MLHTFYTLLADVPARMGHTEDSLEALAEVHTLVEQHEERYWEAEIGSVLDMAANGVCDCKN